MQFANDIKFYFSLPFTTATVDMSSTVESYIEIALSYMYAVAYLA